MCYNFGPERSEFAGVIPKCLIFRIPMWLQYGLKQQKNNNNSNNNAVTITLLSVVRSWVPRVSPRRQHKFRGVCCGARGVVCCRSSIGSLKSPCKTSYWSSIQTVALNCLVFRKPRFYVRLQATEKQTDEQIDRQPDGRTTDIQHHRLKPRVCEWWLNPLMAH